MQCYYDFHIHTALSPCGDADMTPNNIVNMALLAGVQIIGIADHNTCGNIRSVVEVGDEKGIVVVPGIEVQTLEEIHVLCLFPTVDQGEDFGQWIESHLPSMKNAPQIFGEQMYFDGEDQVVGICEKMLITSTDLSLEQVLSRAKDQGGIGICAHIDRESYSVMSNLGFIPKELDIALVEFSKNADPQEFYLSHEKLLYKKYPYLINSDAHYLEDIGAGQGFLVFDRFPTAKQVIEHLRSGLGVSEGLGC